MENTVINELNTVLKGEHMAIESYDKFIHAVEDDNVRHQFHKILDDHKRHASLLENRIKELGGEPKDNLGFAGIMANAKIAMKTMGDTKAIDVVKEAYDGEDKGIAKVEEIIKGDLDNESARLMKDILTEDHEHLREMNNMIEDLERLN
jgi:rubrerythrin